MAGTAVAALLLGALVWAPSGLVRAETAIQLEAPESLRLEGRELLRNGIGVRRATQFFVTADIYAAALYLVTPSSNAEEILDSETPKQINLKYGYGIESADMKRGWQYSFDKSCPEGDCSPYAAAIEQFLARVRGVEPGDAYVYRFLADRVEVVDPSGEVFAIAGGGFSRLLLSTWLGSTPPTEELKSGLLAETQR